MPVTLRQSTASACKVIFLWKVISYHKNAKMQKENNDTQICVKNNCTSIFMMSQKNKKKTKTLRCIVIYRAQCHNFENYYCQYNAMSHTEK